MMDYKVLVGDNRETLRDIPEGNVQSVVTSPPYYGLRDYGHDGQIGLEQTPDEYVAALVKVFREVRRVLKDDGTVWLNIGDSYGNGKQLIGIPWRVAFALQEDGWYLRQDIIWAKPNPMPESVTDRCTKAHEYIFLLSKSARYYYDAEAVKEKSIRYGNDNRSDNGNIRYEGKRTSSPNELSGQQSFVKITETRNRRSVWTVTTQPYAGAHFATFPPKLIEPCILAGTSERGECPHCGAPWVRVVEKEKPPADYKERKDAAVDKPGDPNYRGGSHNSGLAQNAFYRNETIGWKPSCTCPTHEPIPQTVLDPFGGSGTTAGVALEHGRKAILCELNPEYAALVPERINSITDALQQGRLF